jgi:hypothetical protein
MDKRETLRPRALGAMLTAAFLLAMIMGSGPGLRLINPDPQDAHAVFTTWGLPTIYVWGLCWYAVQLAVILTAYFKLWTGENGEQEGDA